MISLGNGSTYCALYQTVLLLTAVFVLCQDSDLLRTSFGPDSDEEEYPKLVGAIPHPSSNSPDVSQ